MPDVVDQYFTEKKGGSTTPASPLPTQGGDMVDQYFSQKGPQGQPSVKETVGEGLAKVPQGFADLPEVAAQHARPILSTVGGIYAGAPGAAAGGVVGQGIQDEYEARTTGQEPTAGEYLPFMDVPDSLKPALSMAKAGAMDGGTQALGPLVVKGLSHMAAAGVRTGARLAGASSEAAAVAPAASGGLPPMPTPPSSFQPDSIAPGASKVALANSQLLTAKGESAAAQDALAATHRALQEGLAQILDKGTLGSGVGVQQGLRNGSAVWRREGGALWDQSRALTQDLPVPIKSIRAIGDEVAMGNQATALAFPRSGRFEPKVQAMVNDLQNLGIIRDEEGNVIEQSDSIPFQALDGFRQKLNAIANDQTDTLAASQAQGILKRFTQETTSTLEQALTGTPAGEAWSQARKFWKEGADIFDHAAITKAINTNPEDVMAMIKPASATTPASITEAKMIRSGALDYVRQHGTPAEISAAEDGYNQFLRTFTDQRFLSPGSGNPLTLAKRLEGYKDVMDVLYDGTAVGRHVKDNLFTVADATTRALEKAGALSKAESTLTTVGKESDKRIAALAKRDAAGAKLLEDQQKARQSAAELQVQAKYDRIKKGIETITNMTAVSLGFTGHVTGAVEAFSGGRLAGSAADMFIQRLIQSKKATGIWAKEVEHALANLGNPPDLSKMIIRPGDGLRSSDATWIYNLGRAMKTTWDLKKDVEPFGPLPTREQK